MTRFVIKIENLPGISNQDIQILNNAKIFTNLDLLNQGYEKNKRILLAQKISINIRQLSKWIALADLAGVKSVNSQYCGLLLHAGIASLESLSQAKAPSLQRQILRLQVATLKRRDLCPSVSLIQQWITEAQKLVRL
ncbi:MAG: DUF4332 domain-containing protein [Cyanobacterium sp. T60_A2020_053]|nr:DUF4332 domain-containing protein [Cyanobacterium sp. T60_A2020_053]